MKEWNDGWILHSIGHLESVLIHLLFLALRIYRPFLAGFFSRLLQFLCVRTRSPSIKSVPSISFFSNPLLPRRSAAAREVFGCTFIHLSTLSVNQSSDQVVGEVTGRHKPTHRERLLSVLLRFPGSWGRVRVRGRDRDGVGGQKSLPESCSLPVTWPTIIQPSIH